MKQVITRAKMLKTLAFGVLLAMMCVLTFVSRATLQTDASDVTVNTNTNEDTDTDEGYLEGDLGGLTFRFSDDGTNSLSATLQILLILISG